MKKIALVTGGNRGLGFETCRQLAKRDYHVILTSRDKQKGEEKTHLLNQEGLDVSYLQLDAEDTKSIDKAFQRVKNEHQRLDVLVNNAAVLLDDLSNSMSALDSKIENLRTTLEINVIGPYRLCQLVIPLMIQHKYGRVVNVSSQSGQLSTMGSGEPTYKVSKAALNAVTCIFAAEAQNTNVLVNSVCPGWVRTDMGGSFAPRSIEKGVETIMWAATLPDGSPTGGFFQDKHPIAW